MLKIHKWENHWANQTEIILLVYQWLQTMSSLAIRESVGTIDLNG